MNEKKLVDEFYNQGKTRARKFARKLGIAAIVCFLAPIVVLFLYAMYVGQ